MYDDARTIDPNKLPDFDLICGGFPCQSFSIAGKRRGFEDARGTLFFEIARIAAVTPISNRLAGAENRTRFGHWESDTVLGMRKTGCFGTHVERKSSFLVAFRIDDRLDNAFNKSTVEAFSSIPDKLKKSFTVDNGKEFAAHKELSASTGMKVYFCDPYSP